MFTRASPVRLETHNFDGTKHHQGNKHQLCDCVVACIVHGNADVFFCSELQVFVDQWLLQAVVDRLWTEHRLAYRVVAVARKFTQDTMALFYKIEVLTLVWIPETKDGDGEYGHEEIVVLHPTDVPRQRTAAHMTSVLLNGRASLGRYLPAVFGRLGSNERLLVMGVHWPARSDSERTAAHQASWRFLRSMLSNEAPTRCRNLRPGRLQSALGQHLGRVAPPLR
jgi:hypothetical protein